jgi:hypothetical protein
MKDGHFSGDRLILLGLFVLIVAALIFYILFLIAKELLRRFDLWVRQRARYLEELDSSNSKRHHHHRTAVTSAATTTNTGTRNRKKRASHRHHSEDDSYSGSESYSGSGSESN